MAKRKAIVHRRALQSHEKVAMELHVLVKKELGVDIESVRLRSFVCNHFHLLSAIVHELHEAEERGDFPKPNSRWP